MDISKSSKIEGQTTICEKGEKYGTFLSTIMYDVKVTAELFDKHEVAHDSKEPTLIVLPLETYQRITSDLGTALSKTEYNRVSHGYTKSSQKSFYIATRFVTSAYKSDENTLGNQKLYVPVKLIGDREEGIRRLNLELNERYIVYGC